MNDHIFFNIFIFLASASIMVPLASRFKLGSVIGYLIVGMIIGPFGLQLTGNPEQIMHFAEFGVIMMLFLIGLELEPKTLWKLRKVIVGLGSLQVILTTAALTSIGLLWGYTLRSSFAVSMALSLSSTALVLQMLEEKNLLKTVEGETSFAVLLLQDIAVIPILIIMPLLATIGKPIIPHHEIPFIAQLPKWLHALLIAGVISAVIFAGHYLSRHIFSMVAKSNLREVFTAFSLALIIGITLLMEVIGVSPALGAFIAGVVLANSEYKRTVETDIQPFKGLLLGLFFISVGMGINFELLSQQATKIILAVSILITVKAVILYALGRRFGLSTLQTIGFGLALSQGGEFAFVLFQFAKDIQVIYPTTANFYTLVVAISMITTPLLMLLYHRFIVPRFMSMIPNTREYDKIENTDGIILAGYGRFGQIIGRVLNGENIPVTVLEKNPQQVELLRKFGYKGYFGDATRLDLLKTAGIQHAKLLIVAVGNPDANLEIVSLAKQHFPHLTIYARARNRRHAYELHKMNVDYFKRELFESSLSMTKEVLRFLDYAEDDIERKAEAFRNHDEDTLIKSFEFFDEEHTLINFSRQAAGELERILQAK